ncbi:MAG: tetratricopeptide repeat protein [Acidobacteria bacterium]|nr:tetratricopeptide repeat protein [Acidobacteriota bacterium]
MDKITRHDLKTDKFAQEVGHTVEFLSEHRRQTILYGGAAAVVLALAVGGYFFLRHQKDVRQAELRQATEIYDATVGPAPPDNPYLKTFPTQAEKDLAVQKAFLDLASKRAGTDEGAVARYYAGIIAADQGRILEAEKAFQEVAQTGDQNYSSLAKYSLAQIYQSQGKAAQSEQLLRSLMEKPTLMVSKEQATIALARVLAPGKPAEARKLLEPLRTERSAVSRAALTALAEIK